jgi:hypothetical protein
MAIATPPMEDSMSQPPATPDQEQLIALATLLGAFIAMARRIGAFGEEETAAAMKLAIRHLGGAPSPAALDAITRAIRVANAPVPDEIYH